jgi:FkbM family methyltransferase
MKQTSKSLIQDVLKRFDIGITSYRNLQNLQDLRKKVSDPAEHRANSDIQFLLKLPDDKVPAVIKNFRKSKAQLRQDLFVLSELGFKERGFFVEFGATNGVDLSNTYLLEKEFGWTGIVAEPAIGWHSMLHANRSCNIDTRCVWSSSGETLTFNEVTVGELSTIDKFSESDAFLNQRKEGTKYAVSTVTLRDLLDAYGAPKVIDYLSVDTEGSEFEILRNFDFGRYQFKVITCEHNFTDIRDKLHKLLVSNGYSRKFEDVSQWDDWYVRP